MPASIGARAVRLDARFRGHEGEVQNQERSVLHALQRLPAEVEARCDHVGERAEHRGRQVQGDAEADEAARARGETWSMATSMGSRPLASSAGSSSSEMDM